MQRLVYADWNEGVWTHRWTFSDNANCAHCHSDALCITAGKTSFCKTCLTQFPNVPWHPTGEIRAKWAVFLNHSLTCLIHGQGT
jgi:hypothetical protein